MNPAWCRQYATSFVPVRGSYFNPNRFECVALSCTAYPCCLFHSATHPFWPSSRLDSHITEIFPEPLRCGLYVLSNLDPPTVQFSAGIVILRGVRREPHYEPLTKPALCLFPELLNSSQRCVLRAIFTNDFCPRCCVWRTSATRTFMGSDFLHSGTLVRTSQTRMVSQRLLAMKSFNTFSANSSCGRMDS